MDDKALNKLEYVKITARLAEYTSFSCSRELAESLLPAGDQEEAAGLQAETEEGCQILRLYPTFHPGGLWDIREALRHVEIGGVLDIEALWHIAAIARSSRMTKTFFSELKGSYPILMPLGKNLAILKTIETAVEKAIASDGSIADDASERLYQIRRKIKINQDRIKERLDSLIHNPNTQKFLQEPIVTIRANRYVVPVKQEYRAQVPGIVHDMSASGASVFVEPMAVMELNNELQKLSVEEKDEIAAILRALSIMVNGFRDDLHFNLRSLARLDFILAKSRLAYEMDAMPVKFNDKGVIRLMNARHPLLPKAKVVPVSITIERNISAMVVTGPNTGGKTVTLKTVGLLSLMAMAGLHLPVGSGSEVCFFAKVFADIGDEQSIEQSLSTFSSHMSNIVHILKEADEDSLVLLDELGAGTDPTEGAALAMAILDTLKKARAKIVATTHYSELKAFAYNNPGFVNASMEFDVATLSPTYRLIIGVPGKSNAFEIATKLGLAQSVIDEAERHITMEDAQVADLLANLEDLRRQVAEEKEKAQAFAKCLQAKEVELKHYQQKIEAEAAEKIRRATDESREIIEQTLEKSQKLYEEMADNIDRIKEEQEKEKSLERAWQQNRKKIKDWQKDLEEAAPEQVFVGEAPSKVAISDYVYIPKLNQFGYVIKPADEAQDVFLQVGILKIMVKLQDLRPAKEKATKPTVQYSRTGHIGVDKSLSVKPEISLRGLLVDDGLAFLDKYIDDAFMAGLRSVRIVHGKGTGAMREAVNKYLSVHRLVKSYHLAEYNEGGMGVTVVELDL